MTRHPFIKINWPAFAILIAYFAVGSLYAIYTPRWQAPDEPAHYNYVRSLAEGEGMPVMEPGDYDQTYLSLLTSEGFPATLTIDSLEYEDHQPPLYYLLAAPIYWLSNGSVHTLRLFSLLLGGVGIAMVLLILREFAPEQPGIAWFGGGLIAFIPQFVAMMASINNDALVLALLGLWLMLALRYLRGQMSPWILGSVTGLLLITKTTGYGALPLTILVLALRYRRNRMAIPWMVRQLVALLLPALLLGALWWLRNVNVYGWPDVLGLQQHNAVVTDQPRTVDYIEDQGVLPFLSGATRTTFQSFWGQFGWMGVVLDARIYQALFILAGLTVYAAVWHLIKALRAGLDARQRDALVVLGTAGVITVTLFFIYNLTFVQHQGRYLFPALPLLALAAATGWQQLLEFRFAVVTTLILALIILVVAGAGFITGDMPLWILAMLATALIGLPLLAAVPERWHSLLIFGGLTAMAGLDLVCLFFFIVPILS